MYDNVQINHQLQKEMKEDQQCNVPFDVALENTGYGTCQRAATIIGGMIIGCSYIGVGAISFIVPSAQCDLEMSSVSKGTLISAGFVGMILSCHMWGFLSDTLGRRYIVVRCLLADGLLYIITSLLPSYPIIFVVRFFHGFATIGSVIPVYAFIGEFHANQHRAKSLMIASLIACFGYLYLGVIAWGTLTFEWELKIFSWLVYKPWRLCYAMYGVPSLICTCLLTVFLPESAKYYYAAGKNTKSIEVLRWMHKKNNSSKDGPFTIKSLAPNFNEGVAKLDSNSNKIIAFLTLMWKQTVPLFSPRHRVNIALVCFMQYLLYFCNNGIFMWLPETVNRLAIFVDENPGETATFCYIVQNFKKSELNSSPDKDVKSFYRIANYTDTSTEVCTATVNTTVFITMCAMAVAIFASLLMLCVLTKCVPKKIVMCVFVILSWLANLSLLFTEGTYILSLEMGSMIMLTGAVIPIVTNTVVDLFPTNIRAMAVCLSVMSARLGTITSSQLAGFFIDHHCSVLLWIAVGAFTVSFFIGLAIPSKPLHEQEKENQQNGV